MPDHVRSSDGDKEDKRDYKLDDLEMGTTIGTGMWHAIGLYHYNI